MSHEIRTPLGAMLGFIELSLAAPGLPDEQRQFMSIAGRNGKHVRDLLDQILDLSKIESGRLDVNPAMVNVRDLIQDVTSLMLVKAKEKNLILSAQVAATVPDVVITDALRLRQILLNALSNAIKFTEQGHVHLWVDAALSPARRWNLQCDVEDTGIGLNDAESKRLFQAFSQANPQVAVKYGGTGLGLTLSRHLARCLGGDFTLVRSDKGAGSLFRLVIDGGEERWTTPALPVRAGATAALPPAPTQAAPTQTAPQPAQRAGASADHTLKGRRVLLADDAADLRLLARYILEVKGITVTEACNGREAVDQALASEHDLILLDLQMPVLDGMAAVKELRAAGYGGPVMALTGCTMSEDIRACLQAGFDGHLSKPLDRIALIQAVAASAR